MTKTPTLKENFKSTAALEQNIAELKKHNKALEETVTKLLAEIDRLNNKSGLIKLNTTPEEEIIDTQISKLQTISRESTLTLDQTRTLDLLLKNKNALEKKNAKGDLEPEYTDLTDSTSVDKLLRLAESVEETIPKESGRSKQKTSS